MRPLEQPTETSLICIPRIRLAYPIGSKASSRCIFDFVTMLVVLKPKQHNVLC